VDRPAYPRSRGSNYITNVLPKTGLLVMGQTTQSKTRCIALGKWRAFQPFFFSTTLQFVKDDDSVMGFKFVVGTVEFMYCYVFISGQEIPFLKEMVSTPRQAYLFLNHVHSE
jgi:hypothetical protein